MNKPTRSQYILMQFSGATAIKFWTFYSKLVEIGLELFSRRVKLPSAFLPSVCSTRWKIHAISCTAEHQSGKLSISIFIDYWFDVIGNRPRVFLFSKGHFITRLCDYCKIYENDRTGFLCILPISGRVDRAPTAETIVTKYYISDYAETVNSGSIPGRFKPKTIKFGIYSFLAWPSAII